MLDAEKSLSPTAVQLPNSEVQLQRFVRIEPYQLRRFQPYQKEWRIPDTILDVGEPRIDAADQPGIGEQPLGGVASSGLVDAPGSDK